MLPKQQHSPDVDGKSNDEGEIVDAEDGPHLRKLRSGVDPNAILPEGERKRKRGEMTPQKGTSSANLRDAGMRIYNHLKDFPVRDEDSEEERYPSDNFLKLPSRKQYPDYYQQIKKPICFEDIYRKLDNDEYRGLEEIRVDFAGMFSNAKRYNVPGSPIFTDAQRLHKALKQIFGEITGKHDGRSASPSGSLQNHHTAVIRTGKRGRPRKASFASVSASASASPGNDSMSPPPKKRQRRDTRGKGVDVVYEEEEEGEDVEEDEVKEEDDQQMPHRTSPRRTASPAKDTSSNRGNASSPVLNREASADKKVYTRKGPTMKGYFKEKTEELINMKDGHGRQYSEFFMEMPDREVIPEYYRVIKRPMDFTLVLERASKSAYATVAAWEKDVRQIFENAMKYNQDNSRIWKDAKVLLDRFDVMTREPPPFFPHLHKKEKNLVYHPDADVPPPKPYKYERKRRPFGPGRYQADLSQGGSKHGSPDQAQQNSDSDRFSPAVDEGRHSSADSFGESASSPVSALKSAPYALPGSPELTSTHNAPPQSLQSQASLSPPGTSQIPRTPSTQAPQQRIASAQRPLQQTPSASQLARSYVSGTVPPPVNSTPPPRPAGSVQGMANNTPAPKTNMNGSGLTAQPSMGNNVDPQVLAHMQRMVAEGTPAVSGPNDNRKLSPMASASLINGIAATLPPAGSAEQSAPPPKVDLTVARMIAKLPTPDDPAAVGHFKITTEPPTNDFDLSMDQTRQHAFEVPATVTTLHIVPTLRLEFSNADYHVLSSEQDSSIPFECPVRLVLKTRPPALKTERFIDSIPVSVPIGPKSDAGDMLLGGSVVRPTTMKIMQRCRFTLHLNSGMNVAEFLATRMVGTEEHKEVLRLFVTKRGT